MAGVGLPNDKIRNPVFFEFMMQVMVMTRMTGYTPLIWHRTAGVGLCKGAYSAGPEKESDTCT